MIPILYKPKETDFSHNGLGKLPDCISCFVEEERNGQNEAVLTFPITTKKSEYLQEAGYQIKAKANDLDEPNVYVIYKFDKDMSTGVLTVRGISRAVSKLKGRSIKRLVIEGKTGAQAMHMIRGAMDKDTDIDFFSDISTVSSSEFEITNPLNCIGGSQGSLLQNWGGEIKHEPFKISLLKNRGRENVTTIRYGKNLAGLSIETDFDSLLTRIFPYADLQNKEGETERIWGKQVDSQYINNYDDIRTDHVQFTEEQGVTDLATLEKVASKYFTSLNPGIDLPKCIIKANISQIQESSKTGKFENLRKIGLCDTVTIYYKRFDIKISAKVNKIRYNSLLEQVEEFTAGSEQYTFFQAQNNQIMETLKQIPNKQYASTFIEYVTQVISGNDGGNVVWWPKNRPSDLFFIDTDDLETAKKVLRINKSGIGFSSKGWKGPFNTAWTLDGVFVADFIKSGTLEGVEIHSKNNEYDIELFKGVLDFKDIEGKSIGTIKSTREGSGSAGLEIIQHESYRFQISMQTKSGEKKQIFLIRSDGDGKSSVHIMRDTTIVGNLNIHGKLIVNGQEIKPGGSGGGVTPPELTTEQEKNAWQVWQFLKSKGYTEQAAAAILGNVEQESGIIPDKDEGSGGPGYGLVQWTSPLAGESGRAYVQRLLQQAGITGDYRSLNVQLQLLEWHMHNGQYIPTSAYPYSVEQFKQLTDISVATPAFEANFERPMDTHPERIGMAQRWYDKFKNLGSGTEGWQNPVRSDYVVTQEWDHIGWGTTVIHGGIDLASVPAGSKPPIYAAKNGTVIEIVYNHPEGGNYVVIDHGDGYWSYYGHFDSVNVSQGQKVTNADVIGIMGATGLASGVHLHFEVWKGSQWNRINPRDVINF
ncbi:phage tail spike protein [Enterococcus sp. LJL128]